MMIDIFSHILPLKYMETVKNLSLINPDYTDRTLSLSDLDVRFRIMDRYEGYLQVLSVPGFYRIITEGKYRAVELAAMANDGMAELVLKYPDRFVTAVACLPLNDMDAALKEAERAIEDLHFRGVEIWATRDKPLDMPEFMPLYKMMGRYNLPVWIHPMRPPSVPDYAYEEESRYGINSVFGWVYETTSAMTRLVFGRVLQDCPDIMFITHHCGAMIPYLSARIVSHYDNYEMIWGKAYKKGLTRHPIDYFRMFYNDTALNGNTAALNCAYDFFGAERLLFATDMPFDSQLGDVSIRETIQAVDKMDISESEKKMIFEDNARRLMRLPV